MLSRDEVLEREPEVRCMGALLSPSTGIVDSHALMLALLTDAEADGSTLALGTSVIGGRVLPNGRLQLQTASAAAAAAAEQNGGGSSGSGGGDDDDASFVLECDEVVNAAGHGAPHLARAIGGLPAAVPLPHAHYAKGNYFGLVGPSPFRGLVYPLPQQAGLGVHATVDLGGRCRFGPDVEWVRPDASGELDYTVDPARADSFYSEVRKYWPALPDGALVPDYAGVRPKLQGANEPARDFLRLGPAEHGVRGLVHLMGIESPGLTSSLALAAMCAEELAHDARG